MVPMILHKGDTRERSPEFISKQRHRADPSFYMAFLFFLAAAHKAPKRGSLLES